MPVLPVSRQKRHEAVSVVRVMRRYGKSVRMGRSLWKIVFHRLFLRIFFSNTVVYMPTLLLIQHGSRRLIKVREYELLTDRSVRYQKIVQLLLSTYSRTRGIFHAVDRTSSITDDVEGESFASIFGINTAADSHGVTILSQNVDSDLLLRESKAILVVPDECHDDLYFLYPGDAITIREHNGVVVDEFLA